MTVTSDYHSLSYNNNRRERKYENKKGHKIKGQGIETGCSWKQIICHTCLKKVNNMKTLHRLCRTMILEADTQDVNTGCFLANKICSNIQLKQKHDTGLLVEHSTKHMLKLNSKCQLSLICNNPIHKINF